MSTNVKVLSWAVYVIAAFVVWHTGQAVFYMKVPTAFWLEYVSIVPAKPVVRVLEPLFFISTLQIHRETNVEFHDILYCKPEGKSYSRHSEQNTTNYAVSSTLTHETLWPYSPAVQTPATCYLNSTVSIMLPHGYTRDIHMIGETFEVIE